MSVDSIVKEIQHVFPGEYPKKTVYNTLHNGIEWAPIIELFASITNDSTENITGLIWLLGSGSV